MGLMSDLLIIDPTDNVGIALSDVALGTLVSVAGAKLAVRAAIPMGHKLALRTIATGEVVQKFGWPIGVATMDIVAGDHVHSHNLHTALDSAHAALAASQTPPRATTSSATFQGYRRADGRVGTRNEIWILCTVGCVARTAERIAAAARTRFATRVDGIYALTHPHGCSQLGADLDGTRTLLANLAAHPNAGGVLIIGLGCESNQLSALLAEAGQVDPARLQSFTAQSVEDEVEAGLSAVESLVKILERDVRTACPLSDLVVGLKCGGSDGFSGISANPLVGRIADAVTGAGGSAVLTEIPELFGAEHLLAARAVSGTVSDQIAELITRFKHYYTSHGELISENPSPGNIAGGITTLEEKSLGAVQKSGRAPVVDVIDYGARTTRKGLTLLEAPGNDAVSSTALTVAGATVILFTTGRGTPLGFPAPTLKIASNSALAHRKPSWIDFNAGSVLEGESIDSAADRLLAQVIATASGAETCAEKNGEREIAIWKRGVTL
jgi:altronate hydrolase